MIGMLKKMKVINLIRMIDDDDDDDDDDDVVDILLYVYVNIN